MADYFVHYPTPIDEVIGIAGELVRHARDGNTTIGRIRQDMGRATDAVDGTLRFPMEVAPHPVEVTVGNVANAAYFASGAMMLFAQAVKTYNNGVDGINAQIHDDERGLDPGGPAGKLQELEAQRARYEQALDDEAARVARMLERGPNEEDMRFLRDHGFLLPLDPSTDPALRAALARRPKLGDPAAMRRWWAGLTLAQQAGLIAYYPKLLGNANGLPAEVRDEANRLVLDEDYNWLKARERDGELTPEQARALKNIEKVREQLKVRATHVDPITGQPVPVQLYIYDPYAFGGEGRVAIATGNLDDADHVALMVPGVGSSVQGLLPRRPGELYDESRWAGGGDSVAVLDWMGYDSPNGYTPGNLDSAGLLNQDMARAGAQQLVSDVSGLRASRSDDPAHLTVIGSSYGSTTAGIAATPEYGLDADDLVLSASPGVPVDDAGDLGTGHDHTWVGSATDDPITQFGDSGWDGTGMPAPLGNDPAEDTFGANRFRAEDVQREDWPAVPSFDPHGRYFNHDSESLYNMGAIVTGQYGDVQAADPRYDPWYAPEQDPEADRNPEHLHHKP
ncbi:MAG TPA: alpha/beta hydrolase [Nocardioidaceae bacterium]|nr:alpha/beta hydrolase [Nocardioidaceae bacterium]